MIPMLEVMIGVFFVFAVSSLTCSTAAELLESGILKFRAKDLKRGLIMLVGSREIGRKLLEHPLIRSLAKQEGQVPTHLPSRTFAIALLDLIARGPGSTDSTETDKSSQGFWSWLKRMGKKALGLVIALPPAPSGVAGGDDSEAVVAALTGSVDDLLKKLDDGPLKRSLTGVLAVAKGQALAEAAASQALGTGAAVSAPVALNPGVVPGAVASPQPAAGGTSGAAVVSAPGAAVPSPGAPNVLAPSAALSGLGGSGLIFTPAQALTAIEKWFDDGMDQVTAWYKRRSQFIILVLGLTLATAMNLDAIAITKTLATDSALRAALIVEAEVAAKAEQAQGEPRQRFEDAKKQLASLGLPIGWNDTTPMGWWKAAEGRDRVQKLIGILLTAIATSLGAPFWFDLLKRVMMVRAGVNPDEDSRRSKQKTAA